jgi:capsular polysaccharide transport system permease protein
MNVASSGGQAADPAAATGEPAADRASEAPDTPTKPRPNRRKKAQTPPPQVVEIAPAAQPARMHPRHWGLVLSFVLLVLAPLGATGFYLWTVASDQYASNMGFTVRQEESGSATDLLGGLAQFAGGGTSGDSDILYEFIDSQDLVARVDAEVDLVSIYSEPWPGDPLFALPPDATIEDLLGYWQRMVRMAYDRNTGLIELQVLAFAPDDAQAIGQVILAASRDLINNLNATARADTIRYAENDLEMAVDRLKSAREALTTFRVETQIVDPQTDIQGRTGVLNNLQQQLAEALIEYELLIDSGGQDPRVDQVNRRIEVIRDRIAQERRQLSSAAANAAGEDYPTLIARYESLVVDREFAEENYRAALLALDTAQTEAARQSRYLATYIQPTRAQSSAYPRRWVLFGLAGLFLTMVWSIGALVYYSIRDRR